MYQPARSDVTYSAPGKIVRINCAQQGSPDGGYRREKHRNAVLRKHGLQPISSEPSVFIYRCPKTKCSVRMVADTGYFVVTCSDNSDLADSIELLIQDWSAKEQDPVQQHEGVSISRDENGISRKAH